MAFRTNKMPVLQEKSASGAVASFNTALAMPLASCNIAVNAWQEGSGEPSPVNDRPIHGFSEVNVTANNVVHTIQLGQEVYGGTVDVVNGVAHVTHRYRLFNGDEEWGKTSAGAYYLVIVGYKREQRITCICSRFKPQSNVTGASAVDNNRCCFFTPESQNRFYIRNDATATLSDFTTWLNNNNVELVYELAEPFDIQLTPTQIETIAGKTNTIFADTGDIDLIFKDLDIAKRGNFREVFKLPS